MSTQALYNNLLRPSILHILRAAGFHTTCPAVLDTLVDLASRYLILLAQKTAAHALTNQEELAPTILDVRLALQDVGALQPQRSIMEEQCQGEEDMRGMEAFVGWLKGEGNREIRRVAGLVPTDGEVVALDSSEPREDFLTALKKKHSKTGEESRYQGTAIGKPADEGTVSVEGGDIDSIQAWSTRLHQSHMRQSRSPSQKASPAVATTESSPLSDI